MGNIIEINGIKMEIDERTASVQRVDTFAIGSPVKLLHKQYTDYTVKFGVIVGFDNFKARPTITVAYLDSSELKYCYIHDKSEHEMVAVADHDLKMEKAWIIDRMKDRVLRKEQELADEKSKMEHFVAMFGKFFKDGVPDLSAADQ